GLRNDSLWTPQASQQHQHSVLQYLGIQAGPKGNPLVGTLPVEVLTEVFFQLQSGISARNIDLGGTGDRLKNIRFCLMEAKSENGQGFHE
ncbi:MAG: hypothetical protein ACKPKO_08220, partial [Candidatus Fonsibacter sp.]